MAPMQACMDEEFAYQDKRLNAVYKRLMGAIDTGGQSKLRGEERDWLRAKRKACDPGKDPGQFQMIDSYSCEIGYTANRASELEGREKLKKK